MEPPEGGIPRNILLLLAQVLAQIQGYGEVQETGTGWVGVAGEAEQRNIILTSYYTYKY